jgi:hypothetical protein
MTRNRAIAVSLCILLALAGLLLAILVAFDVLGERKPEPYLWDGSSPVSAP